MVVFLLAVLGAQVVSAQDLPPCTNDLNLTDSDNVPQAMDVDKNDNGLIEICDLEGLYEMRYALDGSGYRPDATATTNTTGCPTRGCTGFELTKSLDFTDNDSYRTTANRVEYTVGNGWEPIGTSTRPFNTEFEGNEHTISNLRINRNTNNIGLFGITGLRATIANIGLRNVRIIGARLVGNLVGGNQGSITNSYATGPVSGTDNVGGLVGGNEGSITNSYATWPVSGTDNVGGLVGGNQGSITNSYATGSVKGTGDVGGLVGQNFGGSITNSYATGSVEGTGGDVGGLVGFHQGSIMNSYATGSVKGTSDVGGLVGQNFGGSITNSYATGSVEGTGGDVGGLVGSDLGSITNSSTQTVMALETPTSATGIYSAWSTDVWDFGTPNDRPTLKNNPEIALVRIRTRVFLEGPLQ